MMDALPEYIALCHENSQCGRCDGDMSDKEQPRMTSLIDAGQAGTTDMRKVQDGNDR